MQLFITFNTIEEAENVSDHSSNRGSLLNHFEKSTRKIIERVNYQI